MTSQLKTAMLLGLLSAIIIILGGLMGGRTGVIFAFGLAVIMNVGSYWYSDKIVLSMYSARELSPEEAPYLHQIVEELAARAGIPKPRVCIVPEEAYIGLNYGRDFHIHAELVAALKVHLARHPVAAGLDALRPPVRPDAELGVAEPFGRLVLRERLPCWLEVAQLHFFVGLQHRHLVVLRRGRADACADAGCCNKGLLHVLLVVCLWLLMVADSGLPYAKIAQASGNKACFQFPERSLSYAKIRLFPRKPGAQMLI